jgi:hypothetical protein
MRRLTINQAATSFVYVNQNLGMAGSAKVMVITYMKYIADEDQVEPEQFSRGNVEARCHPYGKNWRLQL